MLSVIFWSRIFYQSWQTWSGWDSKSLYNRKLKFPLISMYDFSQSISQATDSRNISPKSISFPPYPTFFLDHFSVFHPTLPISLVCCSTANLAQVSLLIKLPILPWLRRKVPEIFHFPGKHVTITNFLIFRSKFLILLFALPFFFSFFWLLFHSDFVYLELPFTSFLKFFFAFLISIFCMFLALTLNFCCCLYH